MATHALRFSPQNNIVENKQGVPLYDGNPASFSEWEFRARLLFDSSKPESKPEAISKIVSSLRGVAAQHALDMGSQQLLQDGGLEDLVRRIKQSCFPMRSTEAKALYRAGNSPTGSMSRQPTEPMVSYCTRRKRWWAMLKELDPSMFAFDCVHE